MTVGRLETAMNHTVGAFLVTVPYLSHFGIFHQFFEGLGVAFPEQITRPLPAEHGARRVAPRRAVIGLIAGEEIEEEARLEERPFAAATAPISEIAEQLLGFRAIQKVLLVGRPL